MDGWELLNIARRSIYCSEVRDHCQILEQLSVKASKSADIEFIRSVLQLKEDAEVTDAKRKLFWLTSKVKGRFYPPLAVDLAGPLPWNNDIILKARSDKIISKYCYKKPLKGDIQTIDHIRQCPDIGNCSLVASLIVLRNDTSNSPAIKRIGHSIYNVNLHFNGSKDRLVTVDTSSIPTDETDNQLAVISDSLEDKIIELAYLQVTNDSYDCKGSNFAVDMSILTGFAPEIVDTKQYSVRKLVKFFQSELCFMAIGTGDDDTKLDSVYIANHDYPVVSIDGNLGTLYIRDTLDGDSQTEIDDESLDKYFKQVYLIWKTPKLFSLTKTLHCFYNSDKCNKFSSIFDKPKFILRNQSKNSEMVWLLLETNLPPNRNAHENSIAYLKEMPDNIFLDFQAPLKGACDIGLQLIKMELSSKSDLCFFCHSSDSAHFTIHTFSNSPHIALNRSRNKVDDIVSLEFSAMGWKSFPFDSVNYFRNPTFALEIDHSINTEISIDMQLLSHHPHDMINLAVFNFDDHNCSKPLLFSADYTHQKYDKLYTPLLTNTKYKIICSTYSHPQSHEFKVIVAPSNTEAVPHFKCNLQQVFLEHGGYSHKIEKSFQWPENSNRIIIPLESCANNICLIRLVPESETSMQLLRCNVFDRDTHQKIAGNESYEVAGPGGVILDKVEIFGHPKIALLVEKDEPIGLSRKSVPNPFVLIVGSQYKVTIDG